MPIYDYKCQKCGQVTEIFQKTMTQKTVSCARCGSTNMEKLLSAPAAILNGRIPSGGTTCCGRDERCDAPPCSSGDGCRRDR
ncbi:MAG: zinc ribbon domain-containing protein [Candidatus Aminicenantes bacterium]|nr:zinc ribbon domain-containing protein [Candidatus Aminicenantes bacterium]